MYFIYNVIEHSVINLQAMFVHTQLVIKCTILHSFSLNHLSVLSHWLAYWTSSHFTKRTLSSPEDKG